MEFFDLIKSRHTCRSFGSRPVEREKLDQVISAIVAAPSAGNYQSYRVFVVSDIKKRAALARAACGQGHVLAAPVNLVFCAEPERSEEKFGARSELYAVQDATVACTFAMLAATELGLNCGWVGSMDEEAVRTVVGADEDLRPVAVLPLGYASAPPEIKDRRPVDELVQFV